MTPYEYREYLASPHWRWTRRRAIQRAGHRCQGCGVYSTPGKRVRFQVHHLTYARVGKERWSDLAVLCEPCHEKQHGLPEHLTTQDGPEPIGTILNRWLHFTKTRAPKDMAG